MHLFESVKINNFNHQIKELESFISRTDLRGDLDFTDEEKYNVEKQCIQYGIFISSVRFLLFPLLLLSLQKSKVAFTIHSRISNRLLFTIRHLASHI